MGFANNVIPSEIAVQAFLLGQEARASVALDGETHPVSLPWAYLFDLDGTLAQGNPAAPGGERGWFEWDRARWDRTIEPVAEILRCLERYHSILFVTARPEAVRETTLQWLTQNLGFYPDSADLFMRPDADMDRPDAAVKRDLYEKWIAPEYEIRAVFDDQSPCIEVWQSLGLLTLQVGGQR